MSTSDIIGCIILGVALLPAFVYTTYRAVHALRGKNPDDYYGDNQ